MIDKTIDIKTLQSQLAEARAEVEELKTKTLITEANAEDWVARTERNLLEAQADNVKLRKESSWTNHFVGAAAKGLLEIHDIITEYYPGDSINLPKFDYAKKIDNIANDFLNKPHPGAALLKELEQLRAVRDAAEKLKDSYSKDAQSKMNAWHEFIDALAQARKAK